MQFLVDTLSVTGDFVVKNKITFFDTKSFEILLCFFVLSSSPGRGDFLLLCISPDDEV